MVAGSSSKKPHKGEDTGLEKGGDSKPVKRKTIKLGSAGKAKRGDQKNRCKPLSASSSNKTPNKRKQQKQNVWQAGGAGSTVQNKRPTKTVENKQQDGVHGIRLNKYLANKGYCSRREADAWVEKGWVTINGQPAQMGQRVTDSDLVHVEQNAQQQQASKVTVLIHKPIGYVSGQAEDGYEPASVLVTQPNRWMAVEERATKHAPTRFDAARRKADHKGLAVAGRLDIDSTGLLVLTQDGRVAKQLIGENSEIEKEYLVRVAYGDAERDVQAVFPHDKIDLLRCGLELDGKPLKRAGVEWQNPEQLRFVLREGKKRQIRRMCEAVGLRVIGLKRVRIGNVLLGKLPKGKWRYLRADEHF